MNIFCGKGTGKPGINCRNFAVVYRDSVFFEGIAGCESDTNICFSVLRNWTILDWCTNTLLGHDQIIKIEDHSGPEIIFPDMIRVNINESCLANWNVPVPVLLDQCSKKLTYQIASSNGKITGDSDHGFMIHDLEPGLHQITLTAFDCFGNTTELKTSIIVTHILPPNISCISVIEVNALPELINGNYYYRIKAEDICKHQDSCSAIYYKIIRKSELLRSKNGSIADNIINCQGVNGDDDKSLTGNQIYFDDQAILCCADNNVDEEIVVRAFYINPGVGPIFPNRFNLTPDWLPGVNSYGLQDIYAESIIKLNINYCIKECADRIKPNIKCLLVGSYPMVDTACVHIKASDFDSGSTDNCSSSLNFYFNGNKNLNEITVCCEDIRKSNAVDELLLNETLWVEDESGNTDSCSIIISVIDKDHICLGSFTFNEHKKADFYISPNPNRGRFIINGNKNDLINIYTRDGRIIASMKIEKNIEIENLEPGVYFVEKVNKNLRSLSKVVVIK